MKKNVRTVVADLVDSVAPESMTVIPESELELVTGGMQCDDVGTAPTYDNQTASCMEDRVSICR